MPGLDILVVDDDADIRETLGLALELEGYAVRLARDGAEAWALLDEGARPALVLLDLAMPVLDGAALLARIRADVGVRHLCVILVTAFSSPVEGVRAEADGVLYKPVSLSDVLALAATRCGGLVSERP
jgi:CheY-like chemotaxis protein